MNFASDNTVGASPRVIEAIISANAGAAAAYGADIHSERAEQLICDIFERRCKVFLVATGTGANALALGSCAPPWGAVFCHETSHVMEDECGAPEFFTGGAKLIGVPGEAGKIAPATLGALLADYPSASVHQSAPAALSLSQASECGTAYDCSEIAELAGIAHRAGMRVHMDGARFANALVGLRVTPAAMTWKAGVDVLSFGATKNGALACEAIVFFDEQLAANFGRQRKRSGHTLSKGRFLGAQMVGYLEEGHWLDLARHANSCARRLRDGLETIPGVRIPWPTQANEVFAVLPAGADAALKAAGARYYPWSPRNLREDQALSSAERLVRLVCSFATEFAEIARLVEIVRNERL